MSDQELSDISLVLKKIRGAQITSTCFFVVLVFYFTFIAIENNNRRDESQRSEALHDRLYVEDPLVNISSRLDSIESRLDELKKVDLQSN